MSDALAIYLHDHLAGSRFAIEPLESLQEQYSGLPLSEFASGLKREVTEDQFPSGMILKHEARRWSAEKGS